MLRYLKRLVDALWRPREPPAIRNESAIASSNSEAAHAVRAKLASRAVCEEGCPGWVVTIDRDGYEIDLAACPDCWRDHPNPPTRQEIMLLPEAWNERTRADAD